MSFKNVGITPSGRRFYRGEAVLVEYVSHLLCGRISEISTGDFGESVVNVTVDAGVLNTMGGGKSAALAELSKQTGVPVMGTVPATIYLDRGFHHQSTTQTRVGGAKPSLFCFADEQPTFAMAGAPDAEAAPVVNEVVESVDVSEPANQGGSPVVTAPLVQPPAHHDNTEGLPDDFPGKSALTAASVFTYGRVRKLINNGNIGSIPGLDTTTLEAIKAAVLN